MQAEVRQRINQTVGELTRLRDSITERVTSGELVMSSDEYAAEMDKAERMADAVDAMRQGIDRFDGLQERVTDLTEGFETPPPAQALPGISQMSHLADRFYKRYPATCRSPEYVNAVDAYLRKVALPAEFTPTHTDVLREAVDPAGGVLVPPDRIDGILTRLRASSVMLANARVRPTSRDRIEQIRLEPASGTDAQIYSSGFIGSWVAETPAATAGEVEPAWGMLVIPIRKARTKTFLSNDLIADAETDVLAELETDGGGNLGLVLDKGFISGSGVGEPMGLFTTPDISTVDVEGTTADTISNTSAAIGSAPKLLDVQGAVPSQYVNRRWLMHRLTEVKIRKLVDANNQFIWAAGFADRPNELLGDPVMRSDFVPQDGTNGNKVLAYGDFSESYLIGMRSLLSVQVNPFSHSDVEQTVLYLRARAGGDVRNPDAMRIGIV